MNSNDKPFDLLKYITDDFNDKTHPSQSLIDIFLDDPYYYESLISEQSIDPRAACFIEIYASDIEKTKGRHPLSRYPVCNQLVIKFLKVHSINHINWKNFNYYRQRRAKQKQEEAPNNTDDTLNVIPEPEQTDNQNNPTPEGNKKYAKMVLYCPKDLSPMKVRSILTINDNGRRIKAPKFVCPDCGQHYTCVPTREDFQFFTIAKNKVKTKYINLDNRKISYTFRPSFEISPYDAEGSIKANYLPRNCYMYRKNQPSVCTFHGTSLKSGWFINPKGERLPLTACPSCGTVYVSERFYNKYIDVFNCIGQEIEKHGSKPPKPEPGPNKPKKPQKEILIKDFIIRRSTLNCSNKKHQIEEIDALVNFRDRNGEIRQRTIPAGYCPQCKTYFIMESTFDNLKRYGIPLCRIVDEKLYKQIRSGHRLDLASQSILMQYGYNVSQKDNLSSIQRRGILEMLMEERICTKHEIISLLNYFIHMREGQNTNMYDLAISKWEADRDYVEAYGVGKNRKVGIGTIRRK